MQPADTGTTHRTAVLVPAGPGLVIGFVLSSFGVIVPWLAAVVAVVAGWALDRNRFLVLLGLGLAAGGLAAVVVGLGWNLFDAPASGSGSG